MVTQLREWTKSHWITYCKIFNFMLYDYYLSKEINRRILQAAMWEQAEVGEDKDRRDGSCNNPTEA